MESGSEGEERQGGGGGKPKRQMKTPFQLETLERAYADNMYPNDATRVDLSEKLKLTDRQLQMWFCHRRLKDKKGGTPATPLKKSESKKVVVEAAPPEEGQMDMGDQHSEQGSGTGPDSDSDMEASPARYREVGNMASQQYMVSPWQQESPQTILERGIVAAIEQQLGESLQEDGPILGIEFDTPPPSAFTDLPVARSGHRRFSSPLEREGLQQNSSRPKKSFGVGAYEGAELPQYYDFPYDGPISSIPLHDQRVSEVYGSQGQSKIRKQGKQGCKLSPAVMDYEFTPRRDRFMDVETDHQFDGQISLGADTHRASPGGKGLNVDVLRKDRKRKAEDNKISREADDKRIRKELEKQEILRQKREEQLRKEMEKVDRERKKEEERLLCEKQREEERTVRERKREQERLEKFMQRESLKAERLRQKEEIRKEKEAWRFKAQLEKATARRIIRESMGLIEDERLELMEFAVSSKGLESIVALDYDTLQTLESYRDSLIEFPPKSVHLKKPFGVLPWNDSDANIGNLLMVWRFFTTFADMFELWPFTLDEFVQAFHDYDSRLLGEVHVALLKLLLKDIEDAATAPSLGSGISPATSVNTEGGHSHVVEGACAWGFDVSTWKQNLNSLTWPEILRQFALSAGFGPQLKKKKTCEVQTLDDIKEAKGSEDVVSILRNGSAAQNAIIKMQHRGLALPRRSRHRLTPGTLKFAAFEILSLEGSNGLTIMELAERIQKYGLRDLSSSKKPEASIGVALTRDTTLFERVAPSTYCVRPAYRKDPADAEAVIAAAKEKLQSLGNTSLPAEDADGVERDDSFECDVAADKVDEFGTPHLNEVGVSFDDDLGCLGNGNDNSSDDGVINLPAELNKDSPLILSNHMDKCHSIATDIDVTGMSGMHQRNPDDDSLEVDESGSGESWVQGLAEGDYSALSIEERLNALVSLIALANEGKNLRTALEARLEAANALKKQMLAEAELDKKRGKDGTFAPNQKPDTDVKPATGGNQSLMPVDEINENGVNSRADQKPSLGGLANGNISAIQDAFTGAEFTYEQHKYAIEKSRIQLKNFISHRADEMYAYRHLPLGQDRRHNRYWQFIASASKYDPGTGRIFVESNDGHWRLLDTSEAFDVLVSSLDTRGIRESSLHFMLKKIESSFKANLETKSSSSHEYKTEHDNESGERNSNLDCPSDSDSPNSMICGSVGSPDCSSSFRIELGRNASEKLSAFRKYLDFEKWIWKECFDLATVCDMKSGERRCDPVLGHCDLCRDTYLYDDHLSHAVVQNSGNCNYMFNCDGTNMNQHKSLVQYSGLPVGVRVLKGLLAHVEAFIPMEALQDFWESEQRKSWGVNLYMSASIKDAFKLLTHLEAAIRRDCLSESYKTAQELLDTYNSLERGIYDFASPETVPEFPWVPQTTAAVALRLFQLGASILHADQSEDSSECDEMPDSIATTPPSRYVSPVHNQMATSLEVNHKRSGGPFLESRYPDSTPEEHHGKIGRLAPGGKLQKTSISVDARTESGNRNSNSTKLDKCRPQSDISGWGQCIVRGKRTVKGGAKEILSGHHQNSSTRPPRYMEHRRQDDAKESRRMLEQYPEVSDNAEPMDSDGDSEASEPGQDNWGLNFHPVSDNLEESSSEVMDNSASIDEEAEEHNFQEINLNPQGWNNRLGGEANEESDSDESEDSE